MLNQSRRQQAREVRQSAAQIAYDRVHPAHVANRDEQKFRSGDQPTYLASFTKGLPHDYDTGLVANPAHFQLFVRAIDSGDPRDFRDTPLGHAENYGWDQWLPEHLVANCWRSDKAKKAAVGVRGWESQGAGLTFDLEGPDAQAVTMPPAPEVGSDELTAELGEVYVQALLRDVPFSAMGLKTGTAKHRKQVAELVELLNQLDWFAGLTELSDEESARHRSDLLPHTAFRGITPGDDVGPYISQFLLAGNSGIHPDDPERLPAKGLITYGAISIDQRVRQAMRNEDHMTNWAEWFDVQNGANLTRMENYEGPRRFITTPRDLATYVHYDALYEAYLNACLLMLGVETPFDPGIPFQGPDFRDHQQGFAHFGGPHILSLVTEVATRALKAVRYQKFNVHRRCRPEVLAARLEKIDLLRADAPELDSLFGPLNVPGGILSRIRKHNGTQRGKEKTALLPMAFCEGSPMHPAYGAGHATVAGACVTILKAFFDHAHPLALTGTGDPSKAFVPSDKDEGKTLEIKDVYRPMPTPDNPDACVPSSLTVEGELNKLASNISIGRDWAGVHYFTDYIESIRLGEQIAIGILQEQKITYGENFSMTVPLFDGGTIRI